MATIGNLILKFDEIKLRFKIERKTSLKANIIAERTISQLDASYYRIVSKNNSVIKFEYSGGDPNIWDTRSTGFKKIDEGVFEIIAGADNRMVLTYYMPILGEFILFTIIAIVSFATANVMAFLFILPFLIQLLIKIYLIKDISQSMLDKIVLT